MKPVAIFQHDPLQAPGYLLRYLESAGIPTRRVRPAEGDDLPHDARCFSGLVILGSDSSVNDPLPWIERELRLVRDAVARDVPVLGHCFGGQLLAKALGATVQKSPWPNIGWSGLRVTPAARPLFDSSPAVLAFNWHYETFAIPRGATRTLFGTYCLNKGFAFGKHLAFQCHLEITEDIVRGWCAAHKAELASAEGPAVQTDAEILSNLPERLQRVHRTARSVYGHWITPLIRTAGAARFVS
jgi:GMP synthase-like glutamine amidotransferase